MMSRTLHRLILLLVLLAAAGGASGQTRAFDIAAQPLADALADFGSQSGLQVTADAGLTEGIEAQPVEGTYEPGEALRRLLAGTGLDYRFSSEDTVTLMARQGDGQLRPIQVEAAAESAYGPVEGYRATRAATATRTDASIAETPVAVQKVPRDVIDDQGASRIEDAIRNVSSVNRQHTAVLTRGQEQAYVRGFETGDAFRNGFPTNATQRVDLAAVENVEVLKGPASILFGALRPGGVINYQTKRAQPEFFGKAEQKIGQYDKLRTTLDVNGPLTGDKSLLGRVNLAYTDKESYRDEVFTERFLVAPTLTWQPGEDTEIIFDFSYSEEERQPRNDGVPFTFEGEPAGNRDEFFNNPDFPPGEFTDLFAGYTLTHHFADNLRFRNKFLFHELVNDKKEGSSLNIAPVTPANEIGSRFEQTEEQTVTEFQMYNDLLWETELAGAEHDFLVGLDLRQRVEDRDTAFGSLPNLDVFEPDEDPRLTARATSLNEFPREIEVKWGGVYFQDQMTLYNDRLHVLVGGRYDYYEQEDRLVDDSEFSVDDFTGRTGVLFELTDRFHPYASYAESFNPTDRRSSGGDVLEPQRGEQVEAGVKTFWLDDRLTATAAGFNIVKTDVADDLDGDGFPENAGEQRSRGFELDISGELAAGWQVIGSFSYLDTEVLDSATLPEGAEFQNIPETSGSLWVAHDFQPGTGLEGFGGGAGVFFSGDKPGNGENSFELDGYETVDIAGWYEHDFGDQSVKLRLNVTNLFDEEFFPAAFSQARVQPGEPRKVEASIAINF